MSRLFSDISYALRQMRKAPGFTMVAVITLALGIGANAAIFTLLHAIMLRPLPVKNPDALYRLGSHNLECCVTTGYQEEWDEYSYALYQAPPEAESGVRGTGGLADGVAECERPARGRQWPGAPVARRIRVGKLLFTVWATPVCGTPALAIRRPSRFGSGCGH